MLRVLRPFVVLLVAAAALPASGWEVPNIAYGDWPREDGSRLIVEGFTVREQTYDLELWDGTLACYKATVWELPPTRGGVDEMRVELFIDGEDNGGYFFVRPQSLEDRFLRPELLGPITVTQFNGRADVVVELLPASGSYHGLVHSHRGDPIPCSDPRPWFDNGWYFPVVQVIWDRPGVDLVISAAGQIREVGEGLYDVTYDVILSNSGTEDAVGASVDVVLPDAILWRAASADCEGPTRAQQGVAGGVATCSGLFVPKGDATTFTVTGRVTNLSDAVAVATTFQANPDGALEESDYTNNAYRAGLTWQFDPGTSDDTRAAGAAFFASFNMNSAMFQTILDDFGGDFACTTYAAEIYERAQQMHRRDPAMFADLAYGRITTAPRDPSSGSSGHDGVVFYKKGTDYQRSGVVIHGTAGPSRYGVGTTFTGAYNDTDMWYFQKVSRQETGTLGRGFEGAYVDDAVPVDEPAATCPMPPGALALTTASPVDVILTSASGQRLVTLRDQVGWQDLRERVLTHTFAEEDATFGWTMFVPVDVYDVEIVGYAEGPYTLTLTAWDDAAQPVEQVHEGVASVGSSATFSLSREAVLAGLSADDDDDNGLEGCACAAAGDPGGGGIIALGLWAVGRRRRRPTSA